MSELDIRLLLTALVSVLLLVALIVSRIRMHPLLALLVVAVGVGLFAGMDIDRVARAVTNGAGKTLGRWASSSRWAPCWARCWPTRA